MDQLRRRSLRLDRPTNGQYLSFALLLLLLGAGRSADAQRPILPWEGSPPSKLAAGPELRWNGSTYEAPAGAEVHWTISIVNDAIDAEIQIYVTDDLPDAADGLPMDPFTLPADVISKPPDGTVSYDDDLLQYEVLLLDPDETGLLVLRSSIAADAPAGSLICNSARVLYLEEEFSGPGSPAPPRYQSDTTNASGELAPTCVTVTAGGPLLAESIKVASDEDGDGRIAPGEELSYSLQVTNTGDAPATDLLVRDTVPDELLVSSVDSGGLVAGQVLSWDQTTTPALASLAPGATVTLEFTALALCLPPDGLLCNQAWISVAELAFEVPTTTPDALGMSEATCLATVAPSPADSTLAATDSSGDAVFEAGERVAFEFRVTNSGTIAARELSVTMPLLADELDATASDGGRIEPDRIVWDVSSTPSLLALDVDEELVLTAELLLDPAATGRRCRHVSLAWLGADGCSAALSHDPLLVGVEQATCFDITNVGEPPGEVPDGDPASGGPDPVTLSCNGADLVVSWDAAPDADWHSLHRGPLSALLARPWTNPAGPIDDPENADDSCGLDGLGYVDADECLAGGESHYFLVTGSNAAGEGPLGEQQVGGMLEPRTPVASPCP